MNQGDEIVKKGQVEQIYDEYDALRIKVRLPEDGDIPLSRLPYCFPCLPKSFRVVPKIGEGALVITTMSKNNETQRYYLGPIISQDQFNNLCHYNYGKGEALSTIEGGDVTPFESMSNYEETVGSFPEISDVAMVGRGTQDIILRETNRGNSNEVDIRCGIRTKSTNNDENSYSELMGSVIFNKIDPAYIQLKYKNHFTSDSQGRDLEANSIINLVADKINLISHKDENYFNLTDEKELIPESEMSNIMNSLHQVPLGDKLIELLEKIIIALYKHVHPMGGMPPVEDSSIAEIKPYGLDKLYEEILSKHIRIS